MKAPIFKGSQRFKKRAEKIPTIYTHVKDFFKKSAADTLNPVFSRAERLFVKKVLKSFKKVIDGFTKVVLL